MQTLPEEKREKAKSLLIKISVTSILVVILAGLLYFINASKFIGNKPAKNNPAVSQSISHISEKISDAGTGLQTAEGTSKNNPENNYDSIFSKDITIGEEPQARNAEETSAEDTTVKDTSENTDAEDTDVETANVDNVNPGSFAAVLLNMINTARLENGLIALNINQAVNAVAQHRSQDMIERNYFSHQTPEGKNINNILQEFNIMFAACGENIQYASPPSWASPESFFNSWMNSDLHRANILSGNFSQIGIGVSNNNDRLVAVLVFIN